MATYAPITDKVEDALLYALNNIPDAADDISGVTYYAGHAYAEKVLPSVTVFAESFERINEDAGPPAANNFDVRVEFHIESEGNDDTRVEHSAIQGLVEAVFFRSADQVVGSCNAASVSDFTALTWTPNGGRREFEDQRRRTILTGTLLCAASALS